MIFFSSCESVINSEAVSNVRLDHKCAISLLIRLGKNRGVCECDQCKCKTGFLGSNCGEVDCSVGKKNCLRTSSSNVFVFNLFYTKSKPSRNYLTLTS